MLKMWSVKPDRRYAMKKDMNMQDEIARTAYGLYEKRGCANGNDFSDWIEAERLVMMKYSKSVVSEPKKVKSPVPAKVQAKTKLKDSSLSF
jgi:hypothetical protein